MDQENYDIVFRFDIPAIFRYLNVVSSSLTAVLEQTDNISGNETLIYNIILAVHETCTNIVEHAYDGTSGRIKIDVCLNEQPDHIVINIYDTGESFNISSAPIPDLEKVLIRGYGLFLIHKLMDEVSYVPGTDQNHWRLTKKIP